MNFSDHNPNSSIKLGQRASMRFNVLVVGESKSGKSTFLRSLFSKYSAAVNQSGLISQEQDTKKEGVKLFGTVDLTSDCQVHLYESVGYGDQINNENSVQQIHSLLLSTHRKWNATNWNRVTEQDMKRSDDRIHCVFYLLSPHKMKRIDHQFLETLCSLAPIVPVIAKSDSMTMTERKRCLWEVNKQLHVISTKVRQPVVFDFKEADEDFLGKVWKDRDNNNPLTDISEHDSFEHQQQHTGLRISESMGPANALADLLNPDKMAVSSCFLDKLEDGGDCQEDSPANSMQYSMLAGLLEEEESFEATLDATGVAHNVTTSEEANEEEETRSEEEIHYGLSHFEDNEEALMRSDATCNISGCTASGELPMVANVFAVICATNEEGERAYPWGSIRIADERFSDFRRLQRLLLESEHVTEMILFTQKVSIQLAIADEAQARTVLDKTLAVVWADLIRWLEGGAPCRATGPRPAAKHGAESTKTDKWRVTCRVSEKHRHMLRAIFDFAVLVALVVVVCAAAFQLKTVLAQHFGGGV